MRYLQHQPLALWTLVVLGFAVLFVVGISSDDDGVHLSNGQVEGAAAPPADGGTAHAHALFEQLTQLHTATDDGQRQQLTDELAQMARDGADAHADWGGDGAAQDAWQSAVEAAETLAGTDPSDRRAHLAAAARTSQRVLLLQQQL